MSQTGQQSRLQAHINLADQLADRRIELLARGYTEYQADLYLAGYAEGWTRARLEFQQLPHLSRSADDE